MEAGLLGRRVVVVESGSAAVAAVVVAPVVGCTYVSLV